MLTSAALAERLRTPLVCLLAALAAAIGGVRAVQALESATPAEIEISLADRETRLAERLDRLELLAERLAELSRTTQPRRAKVLRDLIARSRERDLTGRMGAIAAALEQESYSRAIEGQGEVHAELAKLLELLLQEDRDAEIESERKRIGRYLQEIRQVIRLERGLKGRTEGGDDPQKLAEEQAKVAERTGALGKNVAESDGSKEGADKPGSNAEQQAGSDSGKPSEGADKSADDKKPSDKPSGEKNSQSPSGEPPPSSGEQSPSPSDGQPSDGQPSQGQPSQGQPSRGQPSQGQPSQGQPSQESPSESQDEQQNQSPADRAVERMRRAQQRMQDAQRKLKESERKGAAREQEEAIKALEQAKAELERILRQLREEELERTLVLLEARFRKMLEAQIEVYEQTKKLDAATKTAPLHEREMTGGRLSRAEREIEREADRALVLMREDGTTVAFPEAIEQARTDMRTVADRLARVDAGLITQGLEEDVIATLEETLSAMQRALQELRDQRARGQSGQGGEPGEQPLVAKLAELRMIRSLQAKVNRRTAQYGALIQGETALDAELRSAVVELGERQQRIYQAAHDLDTREN
ncbi:MAG: hypothetical protein KF847_11960 [Pirellulales bacterium]|nr:hypothetical protein [Pirellulales bacterium]